jgi:hypothetical protein
MFPLILCRERLNRILSILDRNGGTLSLREFSRSFSVFRWELEQASALGLIEMAILKPPTGRPSHVARRVSQPPAAKLPPWRAQIEKPISIRHQFFALYSVLGAVKGGIKRFVFVPPLTWAYQKAFPKARKRRAAAASMSRLLGRYDVRVARTWYYAKMDGDIPRGEAMPLTASAIIQRLKQAKSWRVK